MTTTATATTLLDATRTLAPQIQALTEQVETDRCLPPSLVKAMTSAGIFRMLTPKKLGGLEMDLATNLRMVEEISRVDGSVGWCTMICSQTSPIGGYLPEDGAREIYGSDPDVISGGGLFPPGTAIVERGGYRVTAHWRFASGCQHCNWLLGFCVVVEDGAPRLLPNGLPEIRAMYYPVAEAEIIDTWSVAGMRGTGSHDVVVKNIFVPERRTALLVSGQPQLRVPICIFPIFGLFAAGVSSVATGMARGAIDTLVELARTKILTGSSSPLNERSVVQLQVAQAEALLCSARALLFETVNKVWDKVVAGEEISVEQRARLRLAATNATTASAHAIDLMYHAAGTSGIWTSSPLQRYFRDVHVMSQQHFVASPTYELIGQILLGLNPNLELL